MQLLTVARRATLGSGIAERLDRGRKNLEVGAAYFEKVASLEFLSKDEVEFHCAACLSGVFGVIESLIKDIAVDYLTCYPGHLSDKTISLEVLVEATSITGAIRKQAEASVNNWSYSRFSEFLIKVSSLLNKKAKFDEELLSQIQEIKSTRDIYTHNGGIPNQVYFEKAGKKARRPDYGNKLVMDAAYVKDALDSLEELLRLFDQNIPDKIRNYRKVQAFQEMWDATRLAKLLPFADGWEIEPKDDMVRPINSALDRYWSHSEKSLVDFFLGVYARHYPMREKDVFEAMRRWPPSTNEGRVLVSWMDCPFWF